MYNITLNYRSINRIPAVSEELVNMLKALGQPIPMVECTADDKISFDCEKFPTDEESIKIGETYRKSFNEVAKEQKKEMRKVSIDFLGITNIKEVSTKVK